MSRTASRSVGRLQRRQSELWLVAVAFFGVGDLVTTAIGLQISGIVEAGPLVGPLLAEYGLGSLLVLKILTIAGGYGVWQVIPAPHRAGVPLGLAALGVVVTGWNTVVVSIALLS